MIFECVLVLTFFPLFVLKSPAMILRTLLIITLTTFWLNLMKLFKILLNPRVATAIISAIGAIISAACAGCKLSMGEMSLKDFSAEIFNMYHSTTNGVN